MKTEMKNWMRQAERDLEVADKNLKFKEYYACAFFCQQAVEKVLKSLLIKEKNVLIKTHDLVTLGKKVNIPQKFIKDINELSEAYIDSRYGGEYDKIPAELFDERDANKFIKIAREVLKWAKKKI